ncbi:7796_t:CDS:1, partial [Funneliformis mosseae]
SSFKCCEISTYTNGSEDDELFDYDKLLGVANDDDEVDLNDSENISKIMIMKINGKLEKNKDNDEDNEELSFDDS